MKNAAAALGLSVLMVATASAHHSWASNYLSNEPDIEIAGVISQLEWKNPHVRMQVTVDAGKPTAKTWLIESASVAQLSRMDVTPDLVKVGQAVKVAGFAGLQNPTSLFMNHLLLPDNREIVFKIDGKPRWSSQSIGDSNKLHGSVIETDINKRPASILAVWTTVYGDPNSHSAARSKAASAGDTGMSAARTRTTSAVLPNSASYCAPKAMPLAMGAPYPIQLLKNGKDVLIKLEENDQLRTIHITDKHDDSAAARSSLGYSTGVWAGQGEKKLVVTTTKIDSNTIGARASMTETFELSADRNRLEYTSSIVDPDKSSAPVTSSKYWQYSPGVKVEPYDCTL